MCGLAESRRAFVRTRARFGIISRRETEWSTCRDCQVAMFSPMVFPRFLQSIGRSQNASTSLLDSHRNKFLPVLQVQRRRGAQDDAALRRTLTKTPTVTLSLLFPPVTPAAAAAARVRVHQF